MVELSLGLMVSSFVAGLITFLAPCTLPLVPAFLSFISGVSTKELQDPATASRARRRVFLNGVVFIVGFTFVFVLFGSLAGFLGQGFISKRALLAQIGGVAVIGFGLIMLGALRPSWLAKERKLGIPSWLTRGHLSSSFIIGAAFALGWSPCVGPILGSVLALAASKGSALSGALLLSIFSLGLAVPFLLISLMLSRATAHIGALFVWLTKYRVVLMALAGVPLGLLVTVVVLAVVQLIGPHDLTIFLAQLLMGQLWLMPALTSLTLAVWAHKHREIDVLGAIGGLFMVTLGIILATNTFGLVIQIGYVFFDAIGYQGILEYL